MALAWADATSPVGGGRRLVEWGLFGVLLASLMLVFLHRSHDVQGRAELAAVRTTLGSLRTAAVLRHIEASRARPGVNVASAQRNPLKFDLAVARPYLGEFDQRELPADGRPGWFFDTACDCIGYRPSDPGWLTRPEGSATLVFRILRAGGPLRFEPLADYRWQDEALY